MTEAQRQTLYLKVVNTTVPLDEADLAILRGLPYKHGKTSIRVLRNDLRKIRAKLDATATIMWQWPAESMHWEDALATYMGDFRRSLGL